MDAIIKKNAINFGIISGLIGILSTTIMYITDLKLFVNMWVGFGMLAIWIIIGCVLLSKTKNEKQGILSFKEGFTAYFVSALVGILMSTVFNIFLFNFFDTAARDTVTEHLIEMQVEMLQKFNTPQEKINEAIISIKESSQFSIKGQLFGIAQALVGAIIFGLILAAFFKSKPKEQF
ncbi:MULTISPECIES: DUF4199 domain-containing protein [Flavobacterium]|jgi:hypothetical protein|uniref:DUF4199 domain-containing protein n=1 Tax=Flavobacterium macrobrachii TaxID=591204 RepID=A0ABS2D047_9FLAO|nr:MULTISPECIES: DUF4199 domain-containing protein [Flavobacterium]MBM6500578.1 DUF4199 domain-containing protein [Flavobacterium macrobrachii]MCZ8089064.1 DUF4199 domain-containing protein [Flavobacterium sp.]PZO28952.1 MAG: DUF4199 domain-containing protein [Flavobacteriaceae bacterium]